MLEATAYEAITTAHLATTTITHDAEKVRAANDLAAARNAFIVGDFAQATRIANGVVEMINR